MAPVNSTIIHAKYFAILILGSAYGLTQIACYNHPISSRLSKPSLCPRYCQKICLHHRPSFGFLFNTQLLDLQISKSFPHPEPTQSTIDHLSQTLRGCSIPSKASWGSHLKPVLVTESTWQNKPRTMQGWAMIPSPQNILFLTLEESSELFKPSLLGTASGW
jgi:hypothetical protein